MADGGLSQHLEAVINMCFVLSCLCLGIVFVIIVVIDPVSYTFLEDVRLCGRV